MNADSGTIIDLKKKTWEFTDFFIQAGYEIITENSTIFLEEIKERE